MKKNSKIQSLLISHLLNKGSIELVLPDGMKVELGITREGKDGDLEKCDNYCWLVASQDSRVITMDSFNLGLRFLDDESKIVLESESLDQDGSSLRVFDVV